MTEIPKRIGSGSLTFRPMRLQKSWGVQNLELPEIPDELELMRDAFRAAAGASDDPMDALVESVLARSLLEPAGKIYFNELTGKFVVVEPRGSRDELQRWVDLAG